MTAGDLVTGDWEFEFRGFTWGGPTADFLVAPGVTGLADTPSPDTSDRPRLRRPGIHPGDDYPAAREIIIPVEVTGADTATWEANRALLKQAMRPDATRGEEPLVFQVPGIAGGGKRRVAARPRGLAVPLDLDYFHEIEVELCRFVATDPAILDNEVTTVASGILSPSTGGLTWPLTWPLTWGTAAATTSTTTNAGETEAEWSATITGPTTNPLIEHVTSGAVLRLELVVAGGESVTIDSKARTVLLNGSSRSSALTSRQWFTIAPGANEIAFRADSGTGTMTLTYRNTWS